MRNKKGQTALMLAASQGNLEMVKLLIEKEKNMKDHHNRSATMYAAASA